MNIAGSSFFFKLWASCIVGISFGMWMHDLSAGIWMSLIIEYFMFAVEDIVTAIVMRRVTEERSEDEA